MKHYYNLKFFLTLCLGLCLPAAWGQIDVFNYTGAFVEYTVPPGVTDISIEALGAQGASGSPSYIGGKGAKMYGEFDVTSGDVLLIAVGGKGLGQSSSSNGGGGGGSFVMLIDPLSPDIIASGPYAGTHVTPLIIAGGGAGTRTDCSQNGNPGLTGVNGGVGVTAPTGGGGPSGVTLGFGGTVFSSWGAAGGGFKGNGANDYGPNSGGKSFLNGAAGGIGTLGGGDAANGGFGSGGSGMGYYGGGGGGGYTGGGGGWCAGGGGSYNIGTSQDNIAGFQSNDGKVTIQVLCLGLTPTIPVTGVCIGDELTLYAESETGGTITWSGGVTNGDPFAPPLGTTTYYAYSTSPSDCGFSIDISASEIPDIEAHSNLPSACEGAVMFVWGTGGDTYTWTGSGGFDPIDSVGFAGEDGVVTYTVVGSYLGCEGPADEVTLIGSSQPEVIGTATPSEVCAGEGYVLSGSGEGAVDFYWGGGIVDGGTVTPEAAGTFAHIVIGVSDEGCTDTTIVYVTVNPNPVVNAGMDVTVCEGMDVILSGSGATSYIWAPAITDGLPFPALVGENSYTVTGFNSFGCSDDDVVIVTGVDIPEISSSIVTDEYFGYDGSIDITVTGGSGSYTYLWSHGPITEDVYALTAGIYTVEINDITIEKGMCPYEETFILTSFSGLEDESTSVINAYPNPTTDLITVVYEGQFTYQIVNVIGEVVMNGSANGQTTLSLSELANGSYLIKVMDGDNINVLQVVKQ